MSKQIKDTKRNLVFKKYGGRCAYCGCKLDDTNFNVDHINPLYRKVPQNYLKVEKGTSQIDNLNPSCYSCNSSKSTFTIEQWRKELELKADKREVDADRNLITYKLDVIIEDIEEIKQTLKERK